MQTEHALLLPALIETESFSDPNCSPLPGSSRRTLTILRKGGKIVLVTMAPRTARTVDLVVGERLSGPVLLGRNGDRLDRHAAARIVRRVARCGPTRSLIRAPTSSRHSSPEPPDDRQPMRTGQYGRFAIASGLPRVGREARH